MVVARKMEAAVRLYRQLLKEGKAGKIGMVRAFVHYGGGPGEPTPDSDPPRGLDWDMWCGPGPLRPYNRLKSGCKHLWGHKLGLMMRPPYTPITCICINIRDTGLKKWVPVKLLILKSWVLDCYD